MSNLIALRLNKGLSGRQAAANIGISRTTLERAERGESVHPGSAKKIADFYGVQVTDLWNVGQYAGPERRRVA